MTRSPEVYACLARMKSLGEYKKYRWVHGHEHWGDTAQVGKRACGRHAHNAEVFGQKMYIVGGEVRNTIGAVVYCFDTKLNKWSQLNSTELPRPIGSTVYHPTASAGDFILLLGTADDKQVWLFDVVLEQWIAMESFHNLSASVFLMFEYVEHLNRCITFGGTRGFSRSVNDVNMLILDSFKWVEPEVSGASPGAVSHMSSCVYGNDIFMFGGWLRGVGMLSEINILHCGVDGKLRWSKPSSDEPKPSSRTNATLTNISKGKLMLIGGYPHHFCQDMWIYSVRECEWKKLANPDVVGRIPRISQHTTAFVGNKLILTGSHDPELLDHFTELRGISDE